MVGLATSRGVGQYATAEGHMLLTPLRYKPDGTRPGVIYCHRLGADHTEAIDPLFAVDLCANLALAGYAVLAIDAGGTNTWGNDTSQARVTDAHTYLTGTLGAKMGKVHLCAWSMGAAVALNWARNNPTKAQSVGVACPAVDLAYEHDQNVQGFAAGLETALGVSGTWAGNATITAHDPIQNAASYAPGVLPVKVWFSSNDVVTVTARQQAFVDATGCQSSSLGAAGHSVLAVPPAEVVSFFQATL